ncbi:MAG TPA: ABC transporter permease [Polyangiaceae bacterium]|jgi:putative ABC transport system permease protein|nr:ABC transporter permease [Polyangiaceae bacterium]
MIPLSYNVRSLLVRKTTTVATALGIGLVVFVLASAFMLGTGITKTMVGAGRTDNAIVLRKGSDTEMASSLEVSTLGLISAAPGVKRSSSGTSLISGEVVIVIAQDKLGTDGQVSNVLVRGVPETALEVRPEVHVVAGRPPRPGTDEVMIGKGLRGKFAGMDLEQSFDLKKNRPVKVVGIFESGGSSFESEVWAGVDTARSSFGREGLVSSATVRLDSPAKFDAFKATMESDKRLGLEALTEAGYYEKQSSGTSLFIKIMGGVIVFFLSGGAMIGALITMLAAVSQRQREVGTLRALGFSRFSILSSFLVESAVLSLAGGLLGIACALCMSFVKLSMMNFATWQEVTFSFDPNPAVLVGSLVFGGLMGILGGFYPAVRAASVSPIEAMRD